VSARIARQIAVGLRVGAGLALASLAVLLLPVVGAAQDTGIWSIKSHLPQPRGESAMAVQNGKLYVLGGYVPGVETTPRAEEYEPATDTWRQLAPIPRAASHPGAAALDGKIYVIGGFAANVHAGALDSAFVYEPAANAWRPLAPLAKPRGSVGVAALNGKLHAIGGRGLDKVMVATHEVFDPETGKWTPAAPLPAASSTSSAGARPTTRPTIPICTTSTIRRPTAGARRRRCRPRAAPPPRLFSAI
jgi:hypothetical protein